MTSAITTSSTTTPGPTSVWRAADANGNSVSSLQLLADGLAGQYRKSANAFSNVPVALWGLGVYAMDEWKVKPNLTLTLAIRAERNSNPVCQSQLLCELQEQLVLAAQRSGGSERRQCSVHQRHRLQPAPGLPRRGHLGLVTAVRV